MFVGSGPVMNVTHFESLWMVPLFALIFSVIGFLLGQLACLACGIKGSRARAVTMAVAFNDSGTTPLALVAALTALSDGPFSGIPNAASLGQEYVALYWSFRSMISWGIGYRYFEGKLLPGHGPSRAPEPMVVIAVNDEEAHDVDDRKLDATEKGDDDAASDTAHGGAAAAPVDAASPLLRPQDGDAGRRGCLRWLVRPFRACGAAYVARRNACFARHPTVASIWRAMTHLMTPPVLATLLAFVVGMAPPLAYAFFAKGGQLSIVRQALTQLSGVVVPANLLVLGSNLSGGPVRGALHAGTMAVIIFCRLAAMPALHVGGVILAQSVGVLPNDALLATILMIEGATPSTMNIAVMSKLFGSECEKETMTLLFWMYITCIVTVPSWIMVFLHVNGV